MITFFIALKKIAYIKYYNSNKYFANIINILIIMFNSRIS